MNRVMELDHRAVDISTDTVRFEREIVSTSSGHEIGVIVADGRPLGPDGEVAGGTTYIWPASMLAFADDYCQAVMGAVARSGHRLVFAEATGIGVNADNPLASRPGKLSRAERSALLRGDFKQLAKPQMEAVDRVVNFEDQEEVSFLGYSMGAEYSAQWIELLGEEGALGDDRQLVVPEAIFFESVSGHAQGVNNLARRIGKENDKAIMHRYFEIENGECGATVQANQTPIQVLARQAVALAAAGIGLGRSSFAPDLRAAIARSGSTTRLNEGRIVIAHTDGSMVSSPAYNDRFKEAMGPGVDMIMFRPPEIDRRQGLRDHHLVNCSIGKMAHLGAQLHQL